MSLSFRTVDVFSDRPLAGNALCVVLLRDGEAVADEVGADELRGVAFEAETDPVDKKADAADCGDGDDQCGAQQPQFAGADLRVGACPPAS